MPAVIQSTLYVSPGGAVVPGSTQANSRDDLRSGYQVVLHSFHEATTYSWTLAFASDSPGSTVPGTPFDGTPSATALLAPEGSTSRDAKFNVDYEGTYLVRLVVDAGLPTEDTQFIRCRLLTFFGALKLVAAGERRDENGVIPVDATPEGWANDQNANLQRISILLRRLSTSGRVLYVDANRGRNNAAVQDDYDNVVAIPGPEVARMEETGIKLRAMGHGDFSSINDAIAYAAAAAARGEPAPSKTNPYFIHIRPGFYEEDLNLTSFVHLVGDVGAQDNQFGPLLPVGPQVKSVIVRTANAGGVGTHTYNPQLAGSVAECFLFNLHLENTDNTANAVLDQKGGLLALTHCVVHQQGDAVNQGPAIQVVTADPGHAPVLYLTDSRVNTLATTADRSGIYLDAPESLVLLDHSSVDAEFCVAVTANPTLYEARVVIGRNSILNGLTPFEGYPSYLRVAYSDIKGLGAIGLIISPPGGVGVKPGNVVVELDHAVVAGQVQFNTANAVGTTSIYQSSVSHGALGGGQALVLPDAPGDLPDNIETMLRADTLWYVKGYKNPRLGPAGVATIPVANQVNVEDVQSILDTRWLRTFPVVGSPFFSLGSAYNGASSLDPYTPGVGLGRIINAVSGAIQVQGAVWPTGLESHLKHGGLQIQGVVDIGGFINGIVGDTLVEIGGSEIHLNPNPAGAGPFIGLGRATWPNGVTQPDRGFAGALVVAGGAQLPAGDSAYHLHLRTADLRVPNTGKTGNLYMVAGAVGDPAGVGDAGEVHLVAGSHINPAGTVGNVWLVPGNTATPSTGVIWFVGAPDPASGALRASLTPVGAFVFVPGTVGTIFFGTPSGIEILTFTGIEFNAAAAVVAINAQARSLTAADVAGRVVLYSEYGPAGDILYLGDTVGGALNATLGDYILGNGAVFIPGVYGDKVAVDVPQNGRMRILGDLEVTGLIIGAAGGGFGSYVNVISAMSPYTPGLGEGILGCDTTGGAVAIFLPMAAAPGLSLLIQHEVGSDRVYILPMGGDTVGGESSYLLVGSSGLGLPAPGAAVALYKDGGTNWAIWSEYRPDPSRIRFVSSDTIWLTIEKYDIYSVQLVAGVDITITLDMNMAPGRTFTIKDENGIANAIPSPAGQKIMIVDGGAGTFDGVFVLEITVGYGSVTIYKTQAGNWAII